MINRGVSFILPTSVKSIIYSSPPLFFLPAAPLRFLGVLSSKHPKLTILEGRGFTLGFGEGGHHKRLISYSPPLISSLLLDLYLDLDLNGGERKPDPDLDLLIFDSSFSLCARSPS